jgi:hypothetical protein
VEEAPRIVADGCAFVHGEADAGLGHAAAFLLDLLALVALQALQQVAKVVHRCASSCCQWNCTPSRSIQPARSKAARSCVVDEQHVRR